MARAVDEGPLGLQVKRSLGEVERAGFSGEDVRIGASEGDGVDVIGDNAMGEFGELGREKALDFFVGEVLEDIFAEEEVGGGQLIGQDIRLGEVDVGGRKCLLVVRYERSDNVDAQIVRLSPVERLRKSPIATSYIDYGVDFVRVEKCLEPLPIREGVF